MKAAFTKSRRAAAAALAERGISMTESEFELCIEKYRETVWSAAFCHVKNAADADDITQDVFLKLYLHEGELSGEHLKAWLLRCTVNRSIDLLRSHWYRFSIPLDSIEPRQSAEHSDSDKADMLSSLFMKLSRNNRTVLYMHYYQGYSIAETASILGISESAAGVRLMRGRKQLGKLLEKEGKEYHGL